VFYDCPIRDIAHNKDALGLLGNFDLQAPIEPDITIGLYDERKLIGCCSRKGNILQGLAVDASYQGQGVSAILVTKMIEEAAQSGFIHLLVFTKPAMADLIRSIGFNVIADAKPYVVFLEYGPGGTQDFKQKLRDLSEGKPHESACVVMNCNPFTRGHRYLIEKVSSENQFVYILAVQEDVSLFPFSVRLELIRKGVADLDNVLVIPGGDYVISSLTFPSYFTRSEDLAAAQSAMDAEVFATLIAPALSVKRRYVGTEPYDPVTHVYNMTLKERLPPHGIEVVEVDRVQKAGRAVSASDVREAIRRDDWSVIENLVPPVTLEYLRSDQAKGVLQKIKSSITRH
jgi:[citrate (pro-3S)-lyase] ligase